MNRITALHPHPANFYAGGTLDRAGHRRSDHAWLAERLDLAESRLAVLWRGQVLVSGPDDSPHALLLPAGKTGWWRDAAPEPPTFLGMSNGRAVFAMALPDDGNPENLLPGLSEEAWRFSELRQVGPLLPADDANLLITARALLIWQARTRFCAVCGSALATEAAGHVRRCLNGLCATAHFPRSDPAVIMLVTDGSRVLLGRQAAWPPGLHSVLAGFVEPGESLEEAVAREVLEESGIIAADIRYHSSQPWPFPASLMVGFRAIAAGGLLRPNPDELESAAWFERATLRPVLDQGGDNDSFRLPRIDSISRRMLADWLREG